MWRALIPKPAASAAEPLSAEEFSAAMAAFARPSQAGSQHRIALAVSGGPDSMALAWCTKHWATNRDCALQAFIVDHSLRDGSAIEAEKVRKQLATLDIPADILRWEHPPVVTRLHITARKARYRLLIEACRRHHIDDLLLAHQREDQAETILMRLAKGSGIDGLAGMTAQSMMDGVQLLRPFLNIPKERLVATCRAAQLPFVTDASNRSEKFARGRLRRVLPLLANEGLTTERLIDLGTRAADVKEAINHATKMLLRVGTTMDDAGIIRFDLEHLRAAPRAIAERALGLCLQTIHTEDYAPEHAALLRLHEGLCAGGERTPRTLNGCLVSKTETHATFMREYSAITDASVIHAGESVTWDGRWKIALQKNSAVDSYIIRPLGNPPHDVVDELAPGLRHKISQGRGRASLPALWIDDNLALIPSLPPLEAKTSATAWLLAPWPPCST